MSGLPFAARTPASGAAFHHEAFLYSGDEHFLSGATAFVLAALDAGEDVLVAVAEPRNRMLRQELGERADSVEFFDMHGAGRNPARILPAWQDWIDRHASDPRGFRGISETAWSGRTQRELAECRHHEHLLNTAFEDGPGWWLLCPYDISTLPGPMVEHARASHPSVVADDKRERSADFRSPAELPAMSGEPLEEPSGPIEELAFGMADLGELRDLVGHFAQPVVGRRGADDAVLVVSELAANSIKYGGGAGVLRLWSEDGAMVCEVRDDGVITDPLAGRRRPSAATRGQAGLWIANQVCDLLQIRSAPGSGTVVRAHIGGADRD